MTEDNMESKQIKKKPAIKQKTILKPDRERIPDPVKQEKRDIIKKYGRMAGRP